MEMWRKVAILVFLTVAGAVVAMPRERHIFLNETQRTENVASGSSLILHCCLNTKGFGRCQVSWHFSASGFNETQIKSEQICNYSEKLKSNSSNQCFTNTCNVSDVNAAHAGWYHCEVKIEIPILETRFSNRTEVIVENLRGNTEVLSNPTTSQVTPSNEEKWWMWLLLGVSSLMLIVLLIVCAVQRRRCRRSREDPVYMNTRPVISKQPSPRPSQLGDNLKTVPSSHNLTPSAARRYDEGQRRYKH